MLLLQLFPKRITAHDLCSQGLESLSVDEVCRLMTELGVGYCADVLQKAKVDGEELMLTKRHEFVELLEKNHIRTPKAKKAWLKIQHVKVTNSTKTPPDRCPIPPDRLIGHMVRLLLSAWPNGTRRTHGNDIPGNHVCHADINTPSVTPNRVLPHLRAHLFCCVYVCKYV